MHGLDSLEAFPLSAIVTYFSKHQIRFDHVPNRPFDSISVMDFGSFAVIAVDSLDVVSSARAVPVVQIGDCPFDLFPFQYLKESA